MFQLLPDSFDVTVKMDNVEMRYGGVALKITDSFVIAIKYSRIWLKRQLIHI